MLTTLIPDQTIDGQHNCAAIPCIPESGDHDPFSTSLVVVIDWDRTDTYQRVDAVWMLTPLSRLESTQAQEFHLGIGRADQCPLLEPYTDMLLPSSDRTNPLSMTRDIAFTRRLSLCTSAHGCLLPHASFLWLSKTLRNVMEAGSLSMQTCLQCCSELRTHRIIFQSRETASRSIDECTSTTRRTLAPQANPTPVFTIQ